MLKQRLFVALVSMVLTVAWSVAQAIEEDFSIIRSYGLLANASYAGKSNAQQACTGQGYELTHYGTASGVEAAYFLCSNHTNKNQIIAVRGTANVENIMVDADFKLIEDELIGTMLHSGFAASASAIYKTIKPMLKRDYSTNTTGHSLGGAVAMVLAMYLEHDGYQLGKVITFGQPKVTNIMGARQYDNMDITRIVTEKDMVPLVPPIDFMDIKKPDIYWHAGEELILLSGREYSTTSGISSMLRAVQFFKEIPSEQNLQHHTMTLYLDLIEKKISRSDKVPFKTGISIYDMF